MNDTHRTILWAVVNALEAPLTPEQQKIAHDVLFILVATQVTYETALDLIDRMESAGMNPHPPGMEVIAEVLADIKFPSR